MCLAALFASDPSSAQGGEEWKFQASVYLYLPSVDGETAFPGSGGGSGAGVDASKLLENLNLAFMGSFEADKGPWGLLADVIYVDFGDSESPSRDFSIGGGTLPVGATASIHYDLNGWLWTLAGSWRAVSAPGYELNLIGGARLIDVDQTIDWQLSGNIGAVALPDRAGDRTAGVNNWDAIVGLKGRAMFGEGASLVLPLLLRRRHRRVIAHMASDDWPRLYVRMGLRDFRLASHRLRHEVRQIDRVPQFRWPRSGTRISLVTYERIQ